MADRFTDFLLFGGCAWYLAPQGADHVAALRPGRQASLVSYQRAKAESLGFNAHGGLMERAERFIVLGFALLFSELLIPVLWVMFALHRGHRHPALHQGLAPGRPSGPAQGRPPSLPAAPAPTGGRAGRALAQPARVAPLGQQADDRPPPPAQAVSDPTRDRDLRLHPRLPLVQALPRPVALALATLGGWASCLVMAEGRFLVSRDLQRIAGGTLGPWQLRRQVLSSFAHYTLLGRVGPAAEDAR